MAIVTDTPLTIAPLQAADAEAVRQLLVDGLSERWGRYEAHFNPDIERFPHSFDGSLVLVARQGGHIVGCGALRPLGAGRAEIVRMSVAAASRRQGIGSRLLQALIDAAHAQGVSHIALETTSSWHSAIVFYEQHGFRRTHEHLGDTHFALALAAR